MLKTMTRCFPRSIRRRLSLSYVAIALIAALALGGVLLTTLRDYYAQREMQYLNDNAQAVSGIIAQLVAQNLSPGEIKLQIQNLSFLTQSRVRLLDASRRLVSDSGSPLLQRTLFLNASSGGMQADVTYRYQTFGMPSLSGYVIDERIRKTDETVVVRAAARLPEDSAAPELNGEPPPFYSGEKVGMGVYGEQAESGVEPLPRFGQAAVAQRQSGSGQGDIFVMVSGTPYGFAFESELSFGSRSQQWVAVPIVVDGQNKGFLELSEGPAYGTEIVDSVARGLMSAGLIAVGLAVITGWFISRHITVPLQQLVTVTNRMADGKLSTRVNLRRDDEFGVLGQSFNEMASRVEMTVTALRRFVADAAHELHTPITALHANLELAATEDNNRQRAEFIRRSQEQLKRLETLTNNLLDLSRLESDANRDERTISDLGVLAEEVAELYASRAEQANVQFQCDIAPVEMMARVNETQIRRILSNLLDNALKFTPENGTICMGMEQRAEHILVWVRDTGIGIPPEDLPHLFSRFRRGRNAMTYPGSGLGLAITRVIVENHGGKIHVESKGQGTLIQVRLPAFIPQETAA